MPQIPLPPSASPGRQQARSIGESSVRATPDAFGAGVAEAEFQGATRRMGLYEAQGRQEVAGIAAVAQSENRMWTTAIQGVVGLVGEQLQKDWKLEAEAKLHDLKLGIEREDDSLSPTGDGKSIRPSMESFDARAQKLIDGAVSPFQANILREGVQRLRFARESSLVSREAGALKQARVDNAAKVVEGAEIEVFRDPGQLPTIRESVLASINGSALTAAQKAKLVEETDKRLFAIAIEKHLIDGNIGAAQGILKDDAAVAALGGLESVRAQSRINKAAEDAAEKAQAVEFQRRLLSGEQALDPTDSEQRKIVDKAFTATGGDRLLADGDPNAPVQIAAIAKKYGVVPPTALSILYGMTYSGTPEQQTYALQTVGMIEAARPGTFEASGANKRMREEADDFHFLTSGSQGLGLEPADAIKRIAEKRAPEFKAKADARRVDLSGSKSLSNSRTESELANYFDDAWFSDPVAGNPRDAAVILDTYRKAFEHHYIRTGDEDMAVSAALKDMRRVYDVTRVSGDGTPRIVRNPIEFRLPAIDGAHDWVKEQAVEFIKEETGKTVDPDKLYFESVRATDVALSRGGISTGNVPPYGFYWEETDKAGNRSYQTVTGKLFEADFAKAQAAATSKAQATRDKGVSTGTPNPLMNKTSMPSAASEKATSAAAMGDTTKRAGSADAAKAAAPRRRPQDVAADETINSIIDIFGFGAKGGN